MASVVFIINRRCVRDVPQLRRDFGAAAAAAGWQASFRETSAGDAGLGPATDAVSAGADLVVAAGGDGTVAACAEALTGTNVPLAIVPLGTANLAARSLGVPMRAADALATAFGGVNRRIDVADADGLTCLVMAGMGLDADVVGATPHTLKDLMGWTAYAATGMVHVVISGHLFRRGHAFTIRMDDDEPVTLRARSVVAGNSGLLPGGFVLLPGAQPDDGQLEVGILSPVSPLDWLRFAYHVLAHDHQEGPHLVRHRAQRIEIRADTVLSRQADGEMLPAGDSLTVTLAPAALTVRVPM